MNILLVNLARMGDLVQTTPAIQGLKEDPENRVSVLVTSNLVDFAYLLGADEVLAFEESALLPDLLEKDGSIVRAGKAWSRWIFELRAKKFDLIINLTHDDFSAHLVSLLHTNVLGRVRAANGELVIHGDWMRYFFTMFHFRRSNPFNLADVYRKGSGIERGAIPVRLLTEPLNPAIRQILEPLAQPVVALHPGANHELRRWPVNSYAQLADLLAKRGLSVILVGGPSEHGICEEVIELSCSKPLNLAGQTSLTQLPALLSEIDLLVTNDTGPLHVAAGVGTRTVSIFLAMARPQDTAPCAEGHLVLETLAETHPCYENHPCIQCSCGESVPVAAVANAALVQLQMDDQLMPAEDGHYRVLKTGFAADGCLELDEILRTGSPRDLDEPAASFRATWTAILSDQDDQQFSYSQISTLPNPVRVRLGQALDLADRTVRRIEGRNSPQDTTTIAELEAEWLHLERTAGEASAFLLLYRLQREALYVQGFEALQKKAGALYSRWARVAMVFAGISGEEVLI